MADLDSESDSDPECDDNETYFFIYIWTIENMSKNGVFFSPTFTVREMGNAEWFLTLRLGEEESLEPSIYVSGKKPDHIVRFELSILTIDGSPINKKFGEMNFHEDDSFEFENFAHKSTVFGKKRAKFLPRDALTIRFRMSTARNEISKPEFCFARTHLRTERGSFIWAIREFSCLKIGQKRKVILNPTAKKDKQLTLLLQIKKIQNVEQLMIGILKSEYGTFYSKTIKIHLLNLNGKAVFSHVGEAFVLEKRWILNKKQTLLPSDVLTLRCEFELVAEISRRIEKSSYLGSSEFERILFKMYKMNIGKQNETSAFTDAIKCLLEEGNLSDVSLRTDSKSFPAHKCILSARSQVFKAMFNGDTQEKMSDCVEIPDVAEDTMSKLLTYIYTDEVGELQWQDAADLYRVADKYQLLELKTKCSYFLKSNVTTCNVCDIFILADMHQDQELQELTQYFMLTEDDTFFASEAWKNFKEENPKLAMEAMERIICKIKRIL